MALIDLKTNLKSLKFGGDRPGNGSSGQPYIQTDINHPGDNVIGNMDDGLIRGGGVGAIKSSLVDTLRIGRYLTDLPKGPLFIAKQVGLQLSNPKIEVKTSNLGIGFLDKAINFVQDKLGIGPTRLYNLGINTIAQVPVNAFGVHFNRHGLLPVQDDSTKYLAVARFNDRHNGNRLIKLKSALVGTDKSNIDSYIGGPDSVYGIGLTTIKRADFTRNSLQAFSDKSNPYQTKFPLNYSGSLGQGDKAIANYDPKKITTGSADLQQQLIHASPAFTKYADLKNKIESQSGSYRYKNSEFAINITEGSSHKVVGNQLPTSTNNPIYKNAFDEVVTVNIPWNKATREKRVGSGRTDSINLTPIFETTAGTIRDTPPIHIPGADVQTINDLVKFRIQAINTDNPTLANWMIFRAYITDLSDNVDATWNGTKYAGRGDQFYIYEGFTRKMSVSFKVAALSRYEMEPMYQKLNYLMSNLMPDYSGVLMRGPLMRMTIGNWIDGQLCVLNSLSYKVPQDSPWEIGLNDEELVLPHIVEVTLGFTPIGSQTRDKNELPRKEECVSNIAQNWNGATEREYIVPCEAPPPPPPNHQSTKPINQTS